MTGANNKNRILQTQARLVRMRIARRCITYFIRTLVMLVLVVGVCVISFIMCMRLANAYILVNEGMSLRAECILQDGEILDLTSYFTDECILNDNSLAVETYSGYTITGYDYRIALSDISVLPWNSTISLEVIEQCLNITGSANVDTASADIPEWTPMRYQLTLSQIDSRWYISNLSVLEIDPDIDQPATPDPNLTPMPALTPTPEPTAEVTP